jgi:MFS-type transporter involved in bile tolerance (Atg22 family)
MLLSRPRSKIRAVIVINRVGQSSKTITKAISNTVKVSLNALICAAVGTSNGNGFFRKPLLNFTAILSVVLVSFLVWLLPFIL